MKVPRRFALSGLFVLILISAIVIGLPLRKRYVRQQELELALAIEAYTPQGIGGLEYDKFSATFNDARCLGLYERYVDRDSETSHRITAAALYHLARRSNPRGVELAKSQIDSNTKLLWTNAVFGLIYHHRIDDDIHFSQYFKTSMDDGFSVESPDDVYLLATEVFSNFMYSDGWYLLLDYWPYPADPWIGINSRIGENGQRIPTHSFDDTVAALEKVQPSVAASFAKIIEILRSCDGQPDEKQTLALEELGERILEEWSEASLLRYAVRHADFFEPYCLASRKARGIKDYRGEK